MHVGKYRASASVSTHFHFYLRNICLLFLDHLMDGSSTRFDKYGSMIHKIHAFVPSVIRMGKVEINYKVEEITHEYRNDLPEILSKNSQGGKDDGNLFRRKIDLILWQKF